jgi:hypothetical protein
MNQPHEAPTIEFEDVAAMRLHPLHRHLPEPDLKSPEWHAFVDGLSGAGPERIPALFVTPEGLIMDGGRRWKAAKQLQWDVLPVTRQPEELAAVIMTESLLGQRHLTKGAKVYLALGFMPEFIQGAEIRRLRNLQRGRKTLEKALISPKHAECASEKGGSDLAARLGVGTTTVDQALKIRKLFAASGNHKFEFQDGSTKTLKQHFEALLLDTEHPMGLGEVLKGCGWFVDDEGRPKKQQGPPGRNSHLHYFTSAWSNFSKQCGRWGKMKPAEREQALAAIDLAAREFPAEVLEQIAEVHREVRRSKKAEVGI